MLGCGVGTNSSPKAKMDSSCDDSGRDRRLIIGGLVGDLGWSPVGENPALRCAVSLSPSFSPSLSVWVDIMMSPHARWGLERSLLMWEAPEDGGTSWAIWKVSVGATSAALEVVAVGVRMDLEAISCCFRCRLQKLSLFVALRFCLKGHWIRFVPLKSGLLGLVTRIRAGASARI